MRRKCACSGLMVSIEFGRSPLLGKLYRRTSGSTGPSKFRRSEKGIKKEPAFVRIINSKFNSSQKRVQSRKRVDSRLAKKIGTYLSRVVRARGKTGSNRNRSVRGSWESGTTEDRSSEELEEARRSSENLGGLSIEIGVGGGRKTNLFDEIPRTNSEKEMGQWDRILEKYPRCWQKQVASFRCIKSRPKSDRSLYKQKRHTFKILENGCTVRMNISKASMIKIVIAHSYFTFFFYSAKCLPIHAFQPGH